MAINPSEERALRNQERRFSADLLVKRNRLVVLKRNEEELVTEKRQLEMDGKRLLVEQQELEKNEKQIQRKVYELEKDIKYLEKQQQEAQTEVKRVA